MIKGIFASRHPVLLLSVSNTSSKDEGVKVDGSVENITLTPVRDGKIKSPRRYETRIKAFGVAVVLAVLALSGGLVWWAFS